MAQSDISSSLPPSVLDPRRRRKFVLIGDSITQFSFDPEALGWGSGLMHWLQRNFDVFNRGFSGYNSRWMSCISASLLPELNNTNANEYAIATLFLGANDSCLPGTLQHVPFEEYELNVRSIIEYLRSVNPNMVLILVTPPTVDSSKWPSRKPEVTSQYADAIRRIVATTEQGNGLHLLDLWPNPDASSAPNSYALNLDDLNDGLHLNRSGNTKVLNGIKYIIRKHHPSFSMYTVIDFETDGDPIFSTFHYPKWSDVVVPNGTSEGEEFKKLLSDWTWNI